jgi:uncharacterized protein (DUF302 family)
MKKLLFAVITLAFIGNPLTWSQTNVKNEAKQRSSQQISNSKNLFIESESKFGFDETVEKLKADAEEKTWKITATHDLQESMKKSGKKVLPVKVIALCHPKHSGKILEKDDERIISSMMPCRVSVYTKANGKTYISRMNSSVMANQLSGLAGQVMADASAEIEEILKELIHK